MNAASVISPSPAHDTVVSLSILGHTLTPHASGALWSPGHDTLIVSDLHLEKGASLCARGAGFVPPYDTRATLDQLETAIAAFSPRTVIALGDSFHDQALDARMANTDRERLRALIAGIADWIWVEGNHDPTPPKHLGGRAAPEVRLGALVLRHEPTQGPAKGEIAGHLHPCARIRRRGRSVRRRCFAVAGDRLIMPAMGAFTGGLNVCDSAFEAVLGERPAALMLGADRVWPVAAANLQTD